MSEPVHVLDVSSATEPRLRVTISCRTCGAEVEWTDHRSSLSVGARRIEHRKVGSAE